MKSVQKQAIVDYISKHDPNGELVEEIAPNDDFSGGRIKYNPAAVNLHRSITLLGDEEYVRAFLLVRLVRELGYPPGQETIEFEKSYSIGRPSTKKGRIDIIVRFPSDWHDEDSACSAFLFIECKAPEKFDSDRRFLRGQLFKLSQQEVPRPQFGVYYTARLENRELLDRATIVDLDEYPTFEDWDEEGQPGQEVLSKKYGLPERVRYANVDAATATTRPLRTDVTQAEFERIRHDLHEIIWGGGGANNNDVFVTLVRLFLCRVYDELETAPRKPYQFQREWAANGEPESPDTLVERMTELFKEAARSYLGYTSQQLKETTPFETRKIPASKIAYVVEQLQSLSLTRNTSDAKRDLLGEFFENIVAQDFTQTKGQFFTHVKLVKFCIEMLGLQDEAERLFLEERDEQGRPRLPNIIDPSCGSGTFIIEAMKRVSERLQKLYGRQSLTKRQSEYANMWFRPESPNLWARDYIYGVEPNSDLGLATKVNMILHGDGSTNVFVEDGLHPFGSYSDPGRSHALAVSKKSSASAYSFPVNEQFDFVLTNPPFSLSISDDDEKVLKKVFELASGSISEELFLERWYQLLRDDGLFATVLPESICDTSSMLSMRLFLYKYFEVKAVVSLPYLAFKPFTSTKTVILIARKKSAAEVDAWQKGWDKLANKHDEAARQLKSKLVERRAKGASTLLGINVEAEGGEMPEDILEEAHKARLNSDAWILERLVGEYVDDYDVFLAEPEEVGYKRRKGLDDLPRPNDLFSESKASSSAQTVLEHYRQGPGREESRRFGFWVKFSDFARRPELRCDPKYVHLWVSQKGNVFGVPDERTICLGDLITPAASEKIKKGELDEPRNLIDLEQVEPRFSMIHEVFEVEKVGSSRVVFGDADLAIARLEPYLGKVVKNRPEEDWIGSPEFNLYSVTDKCADVEYVRFLLLMPEMLEAYRCLQSGKRHARMGEGDFLQLRVPALNEEEQREVAKKAGKRLQEIRTLRERIVTERHEIDRSFQTAFELLRTSDLN